MNQTLEKVRPETIALIESQAKALGLSVDEYVRGLLPEGEFELGLRPDAADDEFERDMAAFVETSDGSPTYNGIYSRDDIYFDHD